MSPQRLSQTGMFPQTLIFNGEAGHLKISYEILKMTLILGIKRENMHTYVRNRQCMYMYNNNMYILKYKVKLHCKTGIMVIFTFIPTSS